MKYANEAVVFWYMVMCTYIVLTNPESHIPFIGIFTTIMALYKYMQNREDNRHGYHKQVSGE